MRSIAPWRYTILSHEPSYSPPWFFWYPICVALVFDHGLVPREQILDRFDVFLAPWNRRRATPWCFFFLMSLSNKLAKRIARVMSIFPAWVSRLLSHAFNILQMSSSSESSSTGPAETGVPSDVSAVWYWTKHAERLPWVEEFRRPDSFRTWTWSSSYSNGARPFLLQCLLPWWRQRMANSADARSSDQRSQNILKDMQRSLVIPTLSMILNYSWNSPAGRSSISNASASWHCLDQNLFQPESGLAFANLSVLCSNISLSSTWCCSLPFNRSWWQRMPMRQCIWNIRPRQFLDSPVSCRTHKKHIASSCVLHSIYSGHGLRHDHRKFMWFDVRHEMRNRLREFYLNKSEIKKLECIRKSSMWHKKSSDCETPKNSPSNANFRKNDVSPPWVTCVPPTTSEDLKKHKLLHAESIISPSHVVRPAG